MRIHSIAALAPIALASVLFAQQQGRPIAPPLDPEEDEAPVPVQVEDELVVEEVQAQEGRPLAPPLDDEDEVTELVEVATLEDITTGESAPTHAFETQALREPSFRTGGDVLIRGATVHSAVAPARVADVLVRGGDITAVGSMAAPAGVRVIDGKGLHLAPGVVDAHSHLAISGGVNEGTVSITADVDMTDVVRPDDLGIYRALAGGTTAMQILHGSANAIGGQAELLKLRWRENQTADDLRFESGPKGIKFALGENPKRSNWGTPGERFPGSRMGVEAIYYRAFERAREYATEWDAYDAAVAAGGDPSPPRKDVRLDALVAVLRGDLVVHAHSYRADEILMLLRAAEHFGFRIGTLHHVLEGYKVAREIAEHGAGTSTFSDWWAYKIEAYDAIPGNAALLDEAGVLSSVKSDSGELIRHLYHEAAKSVGYAGMDPVSALQLVTLNPAKQLGVGDRVGSIEVGKDADLVLLDGDPLSVYSKVLLTLVDGEVEFERRDAYGFDAEPLTFVAPDDDLVDDDAAVDPDGGLVTAIIGGTVHTVSGDPISNGTVLFQDGRIVGVGTGLRVPSGAEVVNASGKHLWPGVIALDTSLGLTEISSIRATDDTREMGGDQPDLRVAASIHPESAHLDVNRTRGVTRAQSVPRGYRGITGQSAVIRLEGSTWEELLYEDRDMLHVQVPTLSNDADEDDKREEGAGSKALRHTFEEARRYADLRRQAELGDFPAPPYDPRLEALAPFAAGERRVALHADNAQTILNGLRLADALGLDAVLYGASEAWKVVDAIQASGLPVVLGPVLSIPSSSYDPYDACYANAAVLHRAGVPFAIGAGNDDNPRNLIFHAGFAAAFGLPREEAVRAITYNPAKILRARADLGSIAPGKLADLVLTDGDLLEPTTRVEAMWVDGERISLRSKHTELYDRYRSRAQAGR
ncbi:amidohydrolase family protein [Engelhardtia mirabilis]|uniref:N-acyl-D-aspartate deacylase n=1 Tax=Engelhardtia mirabilis TaxID=2528011 RepID=A0A518BFQ9_9BACT|nr:N-acyl-D-aspartate deacylase [Planctomycetes bacterium Pla133]QDV00146.1 N-acyl-D-aspartate deacylase [Planctomycetes bacterium Pla86]